MMDLKTTEWILYPKYGMHHIYLTINSCLQFSDQFLDLCLLVGCDYIPTSVRGLGIATAHKLVDRHRSLDKVSSRNYVSKGSLVGEVRLVTARHEFEITLGHDEPI